MVDEGPQVETRWYGQGDEELCKILQDLLKAELFLPVLIFLVAFSRQASNPQRKHAYFFLQPIYFLWFQSSSWANNDTN